MVIIGLIILMTFVPFIRMEQFSDSADLRLIHEELSHLAKRVEELEIRDTKRALENEELKARVKVLEVTTERQQDELDHLKNMLSESMDNVQSTPEEDQNRTSIHRSDHHPADKPDILNNRQSNTIQRIRQANHDIPVAFFSTLTQSITNSGTFQQIAFDHEITNIGNGFNKYSGDFRVPVKGIYVFSTTLSPYSTHNSHFQFVANGKAVSNIYALEASSQQIVLDLNQGDTIAIHTTDAGYHVQGEGYSTFSGFLLHQHNNDVAVVGK